MLKTITAYFQSSFLQIFANNPAVKARIFVGKYRVNGCTIPQALLLLVVL